MDSLTRWIRDIVLLVLYITFLEMLVPSGTMRKYVKLATGLIIIFAMLHPILNMLGGGFDLENINIIETLSPSNSLVDHITTIGQEVRERGEGIVLKTSITKTEEKVKGMLMAIEDIRDTRITLTIHNGKLSRAKVAVQLLQDVWEPVAPIKIRNIGSEQGSELQEPTNEIEKDVERRIRIMLKSLLDIDEEDIEVVFEDIERS